MLLLIYGGLALLLTFPLTWQWGLMTLLLPGALLLLPTLGLALFAAVQAWLLWWAYTLRRLDARETALHTARRKAVPSA